MRWFLGGAVLMLGLAGCQPSFEEQMCLDVADAFASTAERCGYDYDRTFRAFVDANAVGDCDNVDEIRDPDALVDLCIPWIEGLNCEQFNELTNDDWPESCVSQLLRRY